MPNDRHRLEITVPPRFAALPTARHQVTAFLGAHVTGDDLDDILLCLQEAMKNAVRFSKSDRDMDIAVTVLDHGVHVVVRDHGVGFADLPTTKSRRPEPMAGSGRGLFLIMQLMDEVEITSNRGADVRMLKRLR